MIPWVNAYCFCYFKEWYTYKAHRRTLETYSFLLHPGLADKQTAVLKTVSEPEIILKGKAGEFLAVTQPSKRRYLVVV